MGTSGIWAGFVLQMEDKLILNAPLVKVVVHFFFNDDEHVSLQLKSI